MSERIRNDIALRAPLDHIVADGSSCLDSLFSVACFQTALSLRVVCPNAGIAVGLKFKSNGEPLILPLTLNAIHNSGKISYVVAEFMCDDVGLREITRSIEFASQFFKKCEI